MKQLILTFCTLLTSFYAGAQNIIKEIDGDDTRFIPGNYMKSGEAAIYFSENEYGYTNGESSFKAEIFDFELNPLKSFSFPIIRPYTVIEQREATGTKELLKINTQTRESIYGLPSVADMEARKNAFIARFYDDNKYYDPTLTIDALTAACRIENTTIYISLPIRADRYPYSEYLKSVEVYFDINDALGYKFTYATNVSIYNGKWVKTTSYNSDISNFCTPKCTDVASMNHWNGGVYLPFSQTFFNDDEKFEYVRYKTELAEGYNSGIHDSVTCDNALEILFGITPNDRDGDGAEDYRTTHFGVKHTGFEVVSEEGTIIYTFDDLPENCDNAPSIQFFKSDNSILAQVEFCRYDDNNNFIRTCRFYRIDKTSGITKIIKEENKLSATPNPASNGTPINIVIPTGRYAKRIATVTSLNGTEVFNEAIEPDRTSLSITTQNFSPGIYLFSLTENGNIIGTCKIIIR